MHLLGATLCWILSVRRFPSLSSWQLAPSCSNSYKAWWWWAYRTRPETYAMTLPQYLNSHDTLKFMPYLDYDKSQSYQSTGCLPYRYILYEHPSSAHPPSSYIRLDAVLLTQVGNLHMVFKQVIGCWMSLVNSILCLPLREPCRLLERMILGSHNSC